SPTIQTDTAVAAHAPAQHDILASSGCGESHCGGDKAGGAPGPRLATHQGVSAAGDRAIIAASAKAAARSNDILEGATCDADLQHATIKGVFQVVVVADGHLCSNAACDGNDWRIEPLVADGSGIIYPRGIRQRIGRRCRQSGI